MAIQVTVAPGKQFGSSETVTNDKLNLLGQPTFVITGTVGNTDLASAAVTASKTTADAYNFATAARTASGGYDIYTLSFSPGAPPTSLSNGLEVWFLVPADNTQATGVKVDAGTGGQIVVYKKISVACSVGDFVAGQIVGLRYNTAIPAPISAAGWELITEALLPASWNVTLGGTPPNYTATLTPPAGANSIALAQLAGRPIIASVPTANAGNDTLAVTVGTASALTSKPIKRAGQSLIGGDIIANQQIILIYNVSTDTYQLVNSATAITPVAVSADSRNLVVKNNVGTPNSKIDIVADEVILKPLTAGGIYYLATSVSLTLDIGGTVGSPLGLDTGAEAASTWYYLWLVYNGTSITGIFSVSSSSPNLTSANLSAYKWAALVGCVFNNGSSNFQVIWQSGRETWIEKNAIFTAKGSSAFATVAGAELTAFQGAVPPIAKAWIGLAATNNTADALYQIQPDTTGSMAEVIIDVLGSSGAALDSHVGGHQFRMPLRTVQSFAYATAVASSTPADLYVIGFSF